MPYQPNIPGNNSARPTGRTPDYAGVSPQGQIPSLAPPPYESVGNDAHGWSQAQVQQQSRFRPQQQRGQRLQQPPYQPQQQSGQRMQQPQDGTVSSEDPVNPLVHSPDWAPTNEDYRLLAFPQQDFMTRVKKSFLQKSGDPLVDQPRSFLRQVPPHLAGQSPPAFRPIILRGLNKMGLIGEGFKPAYVGPVFAPRDVSVADFGRFLEDIAVAGNIGGGSKIGAQVAPAAMHMGLTGYFVTKAILKGLHRRKEPLVIRTIEAWQEYFFGPRGLDVYVVADGERITSRYVNGELDVLLPEVARLCGGSRGFQNDDLDGSSDSDSSIDSNSSRDSSGRKLSHDERKRRKEEIKQQKKLRKKRREEKKKEQERKKKLRRSQKEEEKKSKKESEAPKLVVTALGPGC